MSIATHSAVAEIFTKLAPTVVCIRKIEGLEVDDTVLSGTGVGDMATEFNDLINGLQPENRNEDLLARNNSVRYLEQHTATVRSWKQLTANVDRLILAGKLVDAEGLPADDETTLLTRLIEVMKRNNAKVESNNITCPTPTTFSGNTGSAIMVSSKYASTVEGADASSQVNSKIKENTYRIECVSNNVENAEQWLVTGNIPRGTVTSPDWENVGNAGTLTTVASKGYTYLGNGGFEELDTTLSAFTSWTASAGAWGSAATIYVDSGFLGDNAAKLTFNVSTSPKLNQSLNPGTLQPYTKYLITFKAKKSGAGTGTLKVGFTDETAMFTSVGTATLTTSWQTFSYIFNTGVDPSDYTEFNILWEYTSGTAVAIVDEVTLSPMPVLGDTGFAVIGGQIPAAVGDYFTCAVENDHAGEFSTHFARWHGVLLPASASPTIIDPA